MNTVFMTGIICMTIIALAWMVYDLRKIRILCWDRQARARQKETEKGKDTKEANGIRETAVPGTIQAVATKSGSFIGYYVDKCGSVTPIGRKRKNAKAE